MARELFVYWKLPRAQLPQAWQATLDLQATLRSLHPGLQARLLQRADDTGDRATVMETYAAPPKGVHAALQCEIETLAGAQLAAWCGDGRHVEVFEAPEA